MLLLSDSCFCSETGHKVWLCFNPGMFITALWSIHPSFSPSLSLQSFGVEKKQEEEEFSEGCFAVKSSALLSYVIFLIGSFMAKTSVLKLVHLVISWTCHMVSDGFQWQQIYSIFPHKNPLLCQKRSSWSYEITKWTLLQWGSLAFPVPSICCVQCTSWPGTLGITQRPWGTLGKAPCSCGDMGSDSTRGLCVLLCNW